MNRFAILGLGRWGKILLNEFCKYGDILYVMGTGNKANRDWLEKYFTKIKYLTDIDRIINDRNIDSVIIASPINTHYEFARKCLIGGKNVFLEKPPALTFKEGMDLFSLAKKINNAVIVDNTFTFDEAFLQLSKLLKGKKAVTTIFSWQKWGTFDSDIIWNLAYHDISLAIILYGIPKKAQLVVKTNNYVELILEYVGHNVVIKTDRKFKGFPKKRVTINIGKEEFVLSNSKLYLVANKKRELIFKSEKLPLSFAIEAFIEEINSTRKNFTNLENSIMAVGVIENLKKTR